MENKEEKEKRDKPPVKRKETLDEICIKAKKHNLSYGKYLEARARGKYLDE